MPRHQQHADSFKESDPANGYTNWRAVKRNFLTAFRRMETLQKGKPTVEWISCDEIYLLNEDGKRTRRICGVQKKGLPKGFVCIQWAGFGTEHRGFGTCKVHSNGKKVNVYNRIVNRVVAASSNRTSDETSSFAERNRAIAVELQSIFGELDLTQQEMETVDTELAAYYALVGYVSGKSELYVRPGDFTMLMTKLLDAIVKAKKIRVDMDIERNYISKKDFGAFVDKLVDRFAMEQEGLRFINIIKGVLLGTMVSQTTDEPLSPTSRRLLNDSSIDAGFRG